MTGDRLPIISTWAEGKYLLCQTAAKLKDKTCYRFWVYNTETKEIVSTVDRTDHLEDVIVLFREDDVYDDDNLYVLVIDEQSNLNVISWNPIE